MLEEKKTHPTFEISKQKHTKIEVMNLLFFYSFFTLPSPPPRPPLPKSNTIYTYKNLKSTLHFRSPNSKKIKPPTFPLLLLFQK